MRPKPFTYPFAPVQWKCSRSLLNVLSVVQIAWNAYKRAHHLWFVLLFLPSRVELFMCTEWMKIRSDRWIWRVIQFRTQFRSKWLFIRVFIVIFVAVAVAVVGFCCDHDDQRSTKSIHKEFRIQRWSNIFGAILSTYYCIYSPVFSQLEFFFLVQQRAKN